MKELLRIREFRVVAVARAVSLFGDAMTFMALMLAVAGSGEPARLTVILIAFALPSLVLSGWAGRLADSMDSRQLLVGFGLLQVIASVGLLLSDRLWSQVAAVLVLQIGQAVTSPTWGALVPRIVGEESIGRAVGLQQSFGEVAGLVGAASAGVSFDLIGYRATIAIDTVTFAVIVIAAAGLRTRRTPIGGGAAGKDPAGAIQQPSAWTVLRADRVLITLLVAVGLFILAAEGLNVVEVFLVTGVLGASGVAYGLLVSLVGLGAALSPLFAGRIADDRRRITWMAAGLASLGLALALAGLVPTWGWLLPLFLVVGVGVGTANALGYTVMIGRSPEAYRGRVLALANGVSRGCSVPAMVLGGVCGTLLGPRLTFVLGGLLAVAIGPLVLRARRHVAPAATD